MPTVDLTTMLLDTVNEALDKMGVKRTAENQIDVLNGMHKQISSDNNPYEVVVLRAIEDEIVRLNSVKV